jgi:hypothetical protein
MAVLADVRRSTEGEAEEERRWRPREKTHGNAPHLALGLNLKMQHMMRVQHGEDVV